MLDGGKIAGLIEEAQHKSTAGQHAEAVQLAEEWVPALREEVARGGESATEARRLLFAALQVAGVSLFDQGNLEAAFQSLKEAASVAAELKDMRQVGAAFHELARIALEWHNFPQAAELSTGAVRADALAGCEPHSAMQGLAIAAQLNGNFDEAETMLQLVRESCEARGDLICLGQALHELGMTAAGRNRLDEAIGYLVKAMRVKRVSGNTRGFQNTLGILRQLLERNPGAAGHPLLKHVLESM
jgi:tetratricopeptide (TPR) repeat protein